MDDSFFNPPFIRDAQGPLAWVITIVSVGLMLADRLGKFGDARVKKRLEGARKASTASRRSAKLRRACARFTNGTISFARRTRRTAKRERNVA